MRSFPAFRFPLLVGIPLAFFITNALLAQTKQIQTVPVAQAATPSPSRLPRNSKRRKQRELEKELTGPWKKWMNEDVVYIITDEEKQAFKRLEDRRRTAAIRRAVLAAARSHSGYRRERIQGRALPPYRLRQRPLRVGHPRLEDRPRHDLHQVRPGGRGRIASVGRQLSAPVRRGRRRNLHLSI